MTILDNQSFPIQEDNMERLWTPHRMVYINDKDNRGEDGQKCPFCGMDNVNFKSPEDESLVVYQGKTCYVVLNLFPYNTGHLMICPYNHTSLYENLTDEERVEISELTTNTLKVLRSVLKPDGFNIGINQGKVAGAGIQAHLHQHIVPRWEGDANFFPIVAQTKAIPTLLGDLKERLINAYK